MKNYLLHLETATKVCSVALSLDGKLVQEVESFDEQYSHGEKLTLFVEEALAKEGIKPNDLSGVSVSSGPGSYTGLRIGVSVAKGLCYGLSIPLFAIDPLEAMILETSKQYPMRNIVAMIDARRMEVFCRTYSEDSLSQIEAKILDEQSFAHLAPFIAIGDSNHKLKEVWAGRQITFRDDIQASAKNQIDLAYQKLLSGKQEDLAYFEPFYLKDFAAK